MPLYSRKTAVLAKIETTYGTDSTPSGAANAMMIRNATLTPIELDVVDRDLVRPYFGSSPQLVVGQRVMLSFEVEVAGAGTSATTKAAYDALLQACGLSSTVVSTTHIAYAPVSTGFKSVTIYTYIDGIKHAMVGAVGNVEMEFPVKGMAVMKFQFTGLYVNPADDSNPTLTLTAWQTPLGVNNQNTTAFAVHGYSGLMQSLTLNLGNNIVYESFVGTGGEFAAITDRKPSGQLVIQAPTIAQKDFFSIAKAMTLGALTLTHGTAAFNKFQVICGSTVQIEKPTYSDTDGIRMITMGIRFVPTSAGNDELEFRTL